MPDDDRTQKTYTIAELVFSLSIMLGATAQGVRYFLEPNGLLGSLLLVLVWISGAAILGSTAILLWLYVKYIRRR